MTYAKLKDIVDQIDLIDNDIKLYMQQKADIKIKEAALMRQRIVLKRELEELQK